ncbi:hypothetical protein [Campylobacter avium]|uniref:hypothetical protein n=1 Tax=Campylobacter avium TaxID=522485 RepID=UPI0023537DD8|nr:hypothetical protein [Campylobacter avium]
MKPAWEGEIEEDVRLNDGDNEKVILKRDPSKDGNVFGGSYPLYFYYFTTSGSSTLTLQKDPSLKDMSYYYRKSYHSKSRLSFDYEFR